MKDDLKFLGHLFVTYLAVVAFCLAYVCVKQKATIVEKEIEILRLEQKISELKEVQKSSAELISELASKSR